MLRCLIHEGTPDWINALPIAELAINNSVSDATQLSPFYVVYGTNVSWPVDFLPGIVPNDLANEATTDFEAINIQVAN